MICPNSLDSRSSITTSLVRGDHWSSRCQSLCLTLSIDYIGCTIITWRVRGHNQQGRSSQYHSWPFTECQHNIFDFLWYVRLETGEVEEETLIERRETDFLIRQGFVCFVFYHVTHYSLSEIKKAISSECRYWMDLSDFGRSFWSSLGLWLAPNLSLIRQLTMDVEMWNSRFSYSAYLRRWVIVKEGLL